MRPSSYYAYGARWVGVLTGILCTCSILDIGGRDSAVAGELSYPIPTLGARLVITDEPLEGTEIIVARGGERHKLPPPPNCRWGSTTVSNNHQHIFVISQRMTRKPAGAFTADSVYRVEFPESGQPLSDTTTRRALSVNDVSDKRLHRPLVKPRILSLFAASNDGRRLLAEVHYIAKQTEASKSFKTCPYIVDVEEKTLIDVPFYASDKASADGIPCPPADERNAAAHE